MDIREVIQAVTGVVILEPDQVFLNSALGSSVLFSGLVETNHLSAGALTAIGIAHSLLLILGIGLIMGAGLVTCTAIAFFVVLGVAGGMFGVGALLSAYGVQISAMSQPVSNELSYMVAVPVLSDIYILLPAILIGLGMYRWNRSRKIKTKKLISTMSDSKRFCVFCGIRMPPKGSKCKSCGKAVPKVAKNFCTDCGRLVPAESAFCGFCGVEILDGDDSFCDTCRKPISASALYCFDCGSRIRAKTGAEIKPETDQSQS